MFDLTGRTGIITGASSGIGYSIAMVLAQAGAKVYNISRTGALKDTSLPDSPNIIHLKGDVCDYQQIEEYVNQIGQEEGIDFLINNAGVSIKRRAEEITDEEFAWIQNVNVNSLYKLCCLSYPYLKESRHVGRIINISSMAAHLGFSQVVPYCVSKSAVLGLTQGLAIEWANDNITVNSIAPGWFPSELSRQIMDEERKQKILARMPVHKFGDTKDIGGMALYLLSDYATYITGRDYAVDGGALSFGF